MIVITVTKAKCDPVIVLYYNYCCLFCEYAPWEGVLLAYSYEMMNITIGVNSTKSIVISKTIKDVVYTKKEYNRSIQNVFVNTKGYNISVSLCKLVFVFYCYVFWALVKTGYRICEVNVLR